MQLKRLNMSVGLKETETTRQDKIREYLLGKNKESYCFVLLQMLLYSYKGKNSMVSPLLTN